MSVCASCGNSLLREFFTSQEEANLRLIVGYPGSEKEFWAKAQLVADSCDAIGELLLSSADIEGFHDALPGDGFRFLNDDPAAWRYFLATLHGFAERDLHGINASLPCRLESGRLLCFCAPSKTSVRIIVGASSKGEAWEFCCDHKLLSDASDYFRAALHPGSWREGCSRKLYFPIDDIEDWQFVLTSIHMALDRRSFSLPADLHRAVRILHLCQKYLLDDLLQSGFRSLRDEPERIDHLSALSTDEFVELAGGMDFLDLLPSTLSTWCIVGRDILAPYVAALLKDRQLARVALTSRGLVSFLNSPSFLSAKGNLDADGPLVSLALEGNLDILKDCKNWDWIRGPVELEQLLGEDSLLPLLQVPSFKKALRDPRFCDASLADALAPFPSLLDDLLYEWFQADQGCKLQLTPIDLSRWLACQKFRRLGILDAQLASSSAVDFGAFIMHAPLHDAEVVQAVRVRITSLASDAWCEVLSSRRPTAALDAAAALLSKRTVLRRIAMHYRVATAFDIAKMLASVIAHTWLAPLQDLRSLFRLWREGVRTMLCAQPRYLFMYHMVANSRALVAAFLHMLAYEARVSKTAISSLMCIVMTVSEKALSKFRHRST